MKKIILALCLLFVPGVAFAQCTGVFPASTVCGVTSAGANVPGPLPLSSFALAPGGTSGQYQVNNGLGGFAGITFSGNCTATSSGVVTCTYTPSNGVSRTTASVFFESAPSIIGWGGLGNNSQDNTAAFNLALANVVSGTFGTGVPYTITFPQGSFLFNSKPNADNLGAVFLGVNISQTGLIRNYNEATASNGLINWALGGGQVPNGGRLENVAITAANGTTGGSAVSIIASNSPHGPDFLTLRNLYLSYSGTGAYSASGATLWIDGSAATSAPTGSRDIKLYNVDLFSNGWPAAVLKSVVDFEWYGGNIAGLVTDTLTITGASGNLSTGVNINITNTDAISVDNATSVHIHASAIQGAVTIASTATGVFIESDQTIGGTVTVNSTTSCVRSQKVWYGSGCGGPVLLNTLTASNSATLSDITSLTATYSFYDIVFTNLIPATNNVDIQLQVHTGSSFPATTYLAKAIAPNGTAISNTSTTTYIPIGDGLTDTVNTAPGVSGSLRVFSPSTSAIHNWIGLIGVSNIPISVSGIYNSAAVVDGFQIKASTGNLTSGTVKIYGYP